MEHSGGEIGVCEIGFFQGRVDKSRGFKLLLKERRIVDLAILKADGKQKITAFAEINANKLAVEKIDRFKSGFLEFNEREIALAKDAIDKDRAAEIRFGEIAPQEFAAFEFFISEIFFRKIYAVENLIFVILSVHNVRERSDDWSASVPLATPERRGSSRICLNSN